MCWADLMKRFGQLDSYVNAMKNVGVTVDVESLQAEQVYSGEAGITISNIQTETQTEAIADSAITLASLEKGVVKEENVGPAYYVFWATHNSWQSKAKQLYKDLDPIEVNKDFSIFGKRRAIHKNNDTVFRPAINAVIEALQK